MTEPPGKLESPPESLPVTLRFYNLLARLMEFRKHSTYDYSFVVIKVHEL